jgi:hypothetical protein
MMSAVVIDKLMWIHYIPVATMFKKKEPERHADL